MLETLFIEECKNINVRTPVVSMIIKEESSKNPYSVNVNKNGKSLISFSPKTKNEAKKIAQNYINAGFSVDVGYMQLNSDNFKLLNITLDDALDPCKNLYFASTVFYNFYKDTNKKDSYIDRVKKSLSAYNTGSYELGFTNGYVAKYDKYLEEKYKPMLIKNI
ncbi:lytic transglycosylase domain-containing protein [Arcobacter defluvii]|uniref:P-type type IV conjugative transfer system, lytic transglycosylase VirB1 n=1 Tax=Arcobacter defluvii TaxID=873191 RepID=A0AAE7E5X5_9BACT|nr:lytic transglycosylase domain-containing protein [Arcobacter defluvii]QKF77285.1 P-type type IV conjugative transfer system, lytic transglycosylase VirB1 [Arcobacter defluvii]QKF77871.1 P-type type IV conjugative transfer system, lytic transglycosylase VirB1 [Arcobacter defluvii]RXI32652.1 lytic transglycosylase [Arcobacter defluvii]